MRVAADTIVRQRVMIALALALLVGCAEESWHYECRLSERCFDVSDVLVDARWETWAPAANDAELEADDRRAACDARSVERVESGECAVASCRTTCDPTDGPTP